MTMRRDRQFAEALSRHRRSDDFFPWEVQAFRQQLPESLIRYAELREGGLAVPRNVWEKIMKRHPTDAHIFARLPEVLAAWKFASRSRRHPGRLEVSGFSMTYGTSRLSGWLAVNEE